MDGRARLARAERVVAVAMVWRRRELGTDELDEDNAALALIDALAEYEKERTHAA